MSNRTPDNSDPEDDSLMRYLFGDDEGVNPVCCISHCKRPCEASDFAFYAADTGEPQHICQRCRKRTRDYFRRQINK